MTRRKHNSLLPRCSLKKGHHKYGVDSSYDLEENKQSEAKTDDEHMMDDKKENMNDKKESIDYNKESIADKKESMGDKNCHNSNRVEAGGAQGGCFVDSQVHNNTFHIHSSGRKEFSINYQKLKVIGRGSFGDVWKVKPKLVTVSEEFVMKEIRCCDQEIDAGKKEVELLKQCSHDNIVQYIEHFFEEGKFLILMEFCEGGDLMQLIEKQKTKEHLTESIVIDFFHQMTQGTAYIHDKKILHRDLKPSNIFISSDQNLKIGDFGIAKLRNHTISMASTLVGSVSYIAPEVFGRMPYNEKADVWALGCILYELASLKPAFIGHTFLLCIMQVLLFYH